MIRKWLRHRRARIGASLRAAEESRASTERARSDGERVKAQWPEVRRQNSAVRRHVEINHISETLLSIIHGGHQ